MGQSNARGAAQKSDLTDTRYNLTQTDVRQWTRLDATFGGTASAAMSIPSGSFSIEAGYGYQLRNTAGELPLIFRSGRSGTSLVGSWQPTASGAEYASSIADLWSCYEAAKSEFSSDTIAFGSLVWIQGEADAQNTAWAADYEDNLVELIETWRGEFGASLPVVLVQLSTSCGVTLADAGDLAVMRSAYTAAAARVGNCAVVDASPIALQDDDVHYTADGLMALSDLVFTAYRGLAAGAQHDVTARSFSSLALAQAYADSAQTAHGDRDEDPAEGGFGRRLGAGAVDPWPTTPRDEAVEKHPFQDVWYMPIDGVMSAGALDTDTDARPVDLAWLRVA